MSARITLAGFGDLVARVMEDQNIPPRTRSYLIALVHELRMQQIEGKSRRRSRDGADISRNADIWRDAAWLLEPELDSDGAWRAAKAVIYEDAPRYEILERDTRQCVGTMLRPAGAPCTKRATVHASVPNPMTGERRWHGTCNNPRHREVFEAQRRDGWAAWRLNGEPTPPNNVGGHLRRYLTYSGWDELYRWANSRYNGGATPPPAPPRARLAIVTALHPADGRTR